MPHHLPDILLPHVRGRSLPRYSWAQRDPGSHLNISAITWDQNEKFRGDKSGEYGASGELSFVKLCSCQILHEENRGTRLLRGSWRHLARTNTDVVLPNSTLIARQYYWGLVPCIHSNLLIPRTMHHEGFVNPQSPSRPSLSRHEPSCSQLPQKKKKKYCVGTWKAPVSTYLLVWRLSRKKHFSSDHMTLWDHSSSKSSKKGKLPILIPCWLEGLFQPPLCGCLEFAWNFFHNLNVVAQNITRSAGRDLRAKSWFFFKLIYQNSCECEDIRNLTWILWVKFLSECSLDLLDALGLFIFGEVECSLTVERRILIEAAIWAAYSIHFKIQ